MIAKSSMLVLGGMIRMSDTVATFGTFINASSKITIAPSRSITVLILTISCLIFMTQYECSKNMIINTL